MKASKSILIILCLCLSLQSHAQTIHFIGLFDTNDAKIGRGMNIEKYLICNEMKTIIGYLKEFGYKEGNFWVFDGVNCNPQMAIGSVNALKTNDDDTVIFYYGGHGARALNDNDPFPQMCLGQHNPRQFVPASLIRNIIQKKKLRSAVVLTGCCNFEDRDVEIKSITVQSQSHTVEAGVNKQAFKKLFMESKGTFQMTSSRAGEYSFTTDVGSFFARELLNVLKMVGENKVAPTWENVFKRTQQIVSQKDIICEGERYTQHPDYRLPHNMNTNVYDYDCNNEEKRIVVDNNLQYALNELLNKSLSTNERLRVVPSIISKYFTSDAKVITLGHNMTTVIDYEDVGVFLRRIAISPYLKQVNVVEQKSGKNSLISVHEVRTQ